MLDLTREERKVVLFLLAVALTGAGIKYALKKRLYAAEFVKIDESLTHIDLNKADLAQILRAKALPRKLAEGILAYRAAHGPYPTLEEVKKVKGVGKVRYEKIKEIFFVE